MALATVQKTPAVLTDAGGHTSTLTFGSLPTAGHGIVIAYANAVAANPILDPTIADNQGVGNVYVKAKAGTEASGGQMAAVWYCASIGATSGTFTITITHNATSNNYSDLVASEVNNSIALDQTGISTTTTAGVTTVTAAGALATTDEIIFCTYTEDSSASGTSTISADVSYTNDMNSANTAVHIGASGDHKSVTVTTAPACAYTSTASTHGTFADAVAVMATFKVGSAVAANQPHLTLLGAG